jgi:hypothetical protein
MSTTSNGTTEPADESPEEKLAGEDIAAAAVLEFSAALARFSRGLRAGQLMRAAYHDMDPEALAVLLAALDDAELERLQRAATVLTTAVVTAREAAS